MVSPAYRPLPGNGPVAQLLRHTHLLSIFLAGSLILAGCGDQQFRTAGGTVSAGLAGTVHGGQQPVAGATIQLYAVGSAGDGSASTPLLTTTELTNSNGQFNLGPYTCPSALTDIYLTATGGNPGLQSGQTNPDISNMVALGPCGNVTSNTFVDVNELTTVAATYALAPFMQSYTQVGSGQLDAQLMADAFTLAGEMVNTGTGAVPGPGVPTGQTVPIQKIKALANIVSACVNSPGGVAGDGSACGSLLSLATPAGGAAPKDTIGALLNIAKNPTAQVVPLYILSPPIAPFQPTLTSAPADWSLNLSTPTAAPVFSPAPGTYAVSPSITLSDTTNGAQIYYTTDGSTPTTSSQLYSGAIQLPATAIVRAIAVAAGIGSLPVAGTYTVVTPTITLTPSTVSLTQSQTQAFAAAVSGTSNTSVIWSLIPAVGTISTAGVYTAPAAITSAQAVTVTATSAADSAVSASSIVSLVAPISVSLTPGNVTLKPSQTQAFTATVSNSSNTAVTWSLNPSLGSISASGLYTAPATIGSAQSVTVTATSAANSTKPATATISLSPLVGATYYLSPSGVDSNSGTSKRPWLTPNHSVNCGDVLIAQAGTYSSSNFTRGWGTVKCSGGNNVAWVQCATFDACKISITSGDGMDVDESYWGVSGFEVDGTASAGVCFFAALSSATNIHHIIFANNVANGCGGGGIAASPNGTHGVDYLVIVGNIVHGTAGGSLYCGSGISIYEPVAYDTQSGTHIYIAGNESDGNFNPGTCGGSKPTDGNGVILDTLDGSQSNGTIPPYTQQLVVENNLLLANGGRGLLVYNNATGTAPFAHVYMRYNTLWGNNRDTNETAISWRCAEVVLNTVANVELYDSIAVAAQSKGCSGGTETIYAVSMYNDNATDAVTYTAGYTPGGTNTSLLYSTGFSFATNNMFGTNPNFANPIIPSSPSCGSYTNAQGCMAKIVSDFTPTTAAVAAFGYQAPGTTPVNNPLYPQWLCNVALPTGLVTPGCATSAQ